MPTATLTPVRGQLLRDAEVVTTGPRAPQITLIVTCPSPPVANDVDVQHTWLKATLAGPAAAHALGLGILSRLKRGASVRLGGTLTRYTVDQAYGMTIARCTMQAESLQLPREA